MHESELGVKALMNTTPLNKIKKRPWYNLYPGEIKDALETYVIPVVPLARFLESSATYYPDANAVVYEPENLLINYKELFNLSKRFAAGLINRFNIKKGDRIAIYSRNYPEFLIAQYGILLAGATYVAINPILIKEEVEYQLKDSNTKLAVISDDNVHIFKDIVHDKKTPLETVIVFTRDRELKPDFLNGSENIFEAPFFKFKNIFSNDVYKEPEIDPIEDLAAIIYTAGTTGVPKGAMISHYNAVSSCISYYSVYTGKFPELSENGLLICNNFQKDLTDAWEFPMRYGIDSALAAAPWTHMMGYIAKMDKDGFFYITGRKKDIIIYKGYNIAPRMLEEVLYQHPLIFQCAVVGKNDPEAGEIPVAFVSLKEGGNVSPDEIMQFVNEKVAGYKKLRQVYIINSLPVSGAGKILHKNLRETLNDDK